MDGIVYAAAVSLGFAAFENIGYLMSSEDWVSTGIMRALFSVPGHMFFGILMGYYYSLVRFDPTASGMTKFWVLGAPIIAHGIYDSILFSMDTLPEALSLALILLMDLCLLVYDYGLPGNLRIYEKRIRPYLRFIHR
jgi:RsiW-degrading membrane proteinase PrsW (M82 family)